MLTKQTQHAKAGKALRQLRERDSTQIGTIACEASEGESGMTNHQLLERRHAGEAVLHALEVNIVVVQEQLAQRGKRDTSKERIVCDLQMQRFQLRQHQGSGDRRSCLCFVVVLSDLQLLEGGLGWARALESAADAAAG